MAPSYVLLVGFICESAIAYVALKQVPEQFLGGTALKTLLFPVIPVSAAPFMAAFIALHSARRTRKHESLVARYSRYMVYVGIVVSSFAIGGGHAFGGALAGAWLLQWGVLLTGLIHFVLLEWQRRLKPQSEKTLADAQVVLTFRCST